MKFHLAICSLLLPILTWGQPSTNEYSVKVLRDQKVPTPEAAALLGSINAPVGGYTGKPSISIPLHEIRVKNVSIPISLNYGAAGGLKVGEMATSVGIGWSMSTTFMITGNNNGGQCDLYSSYLNGPTLPLSWQPTGYPIVTTNNDITPPAWIASVPPIMTPAQQLVLNALRGATREENPADLQADEFSYSFPGKTGKFMFLRNKTILTLELDPVYISFHNDVFECKDQYGTKYLFEKKEVIADSTNDQNTVTPLSMRYSYNFLLTKIITISKDTVDFHYSATKYSFESLKGLTRDVRVNLGVRVCPEYSNPISYNSRTVINGFRLDSISSSQGDKVRFVYTFSRQDVQHIQGSPNGIITNIQALSQGNIIKEFNLIYTEMGGRPNLSRVQQLGLPPYEFLYHLPSEFPNKFSNAQDHWGFYNGRHDNTTLLPIEYAMGIGTGATRDVDTAKAKVGILREIKYPTGGRAMFDYESNSIHPSRVQHSYSPYFKNHIETIEEQLGSSAFSRTISYPSKCIAVVIEVIPGEINPNATQIVNEDGSILLPTVFLPNVDVQTTIAPYNLTASFVPAQNGILTAYLRYNHNGAVVVYPGNPGILHPGRIRYKYVYINDLEDVIVGGLRVKSIQEFDDQGMVSQRRFSYNDPATNRSSGEIPGFLQYSYLSWRFQSMSEIDGQAEVWCFKTTQTVNNVLNSFNSEGSVVGYRYMTEYSGTGSSQIKSVSKFIAGSNPYVHLVWPRTPTVDYRPLDGKLIEKEDFLLREGVHVPQKRSTYMYGIGTRSRDSNSRVSHELSSWSIDEEMGGWSIVPNGSINFVLAKFLFEPRQIFLLGTKEEFYEYGTTLSDSSKWVSGSFYKYNFADLGVADEVTQYLPGGDSLITKYRFAKQPQRTLYYHQIPLTSHLITEDGNRLLLEATFKKNGNVINLVSAAKFGYNLHPTDPDSIYVYNTQREINVQNLFQNFATVPLGTLQGAFDFQAAITERDNKGNALAMLSSDMSRSSFVWDTDGRILVARADNCLPQELGYLSFNHAVGKLKPIVYGLQYLGTIMPRSGRSHSAALSITGGYVRKSITAGSYLLRITVKSFNPLVTLNGASVPLRVVHEANGWSTWQALVNSSGLSQLSITGSGLIDEVVVHPTQSVVTTASIMPGAGAVRSTQPNGINTFYQYDSVNRLNRILDIDGNILTALFYNHKSN